MRARCDTNDVVYNVIFIEIYKPITYIRLYRLSINKRFKQQNAVFLS